MRNNDFDVVIVGAGISGIGAAYHLQTQCPTRSYAVLEGRENIGGTWDLFKYPGIRSDSDMHTMGYSFKPWRSDKAIADGPSILEYVNEAADENGIRERIQFNHKVTQASWSSDDATWTVHARVGEAQVMYTCRFLFMCSGYYNYEHGYEPDIPGLDTFAGKVIHPQHWDTDYDYADKSVVVIGSGATAVTIVPEMAKTARHVTMLQRSPTYMVSAPDEDRISKKLKELFAPKLAYGITRWKNVLFGMLFYTFCQKFPEKAKEMILKGVRAAMGPGYDVERHFTPRYKPWDQRMCLVPNSDFFDAVRNDRASIVTDTIDHVTERGVVCTSGEVLEADLIVTATGLDLCILSDIEFAVDGEPVLPGDCVAYKSMMLSGVPNMAFSMGYTNASWTLKCDLTCDYVARLLNHMERNGYQQVTPRLRDESVRAEPMLNLTSGYVVRAADKLPKQGDRPPWKLHQNYLLDLVNLRYRSIEDDALEFVRRAPVKEISEAAA
jgi:cation diffusion facilitator CzcD-associated flavoprotein CzcO